MEPVLKWAGGKRQLLNELSKFVNNELLKGHKYYEPFVGGGALFLALEHNNIVINDSNSELINVYNVIKNNPNELIAELNNHAKKHSKEHFYEVRAWDRKPSYLKMSDVKRAARIIYLNKTCFNGLYRVNSKGYYNVPIGRSVTANQDIVMSSRILNLSNYLNNNDIVIRCGDFAESVKDAKEGDFVFFDPPYDYEKEGFNYYVKTGFTHKDLERLKKVCDSLIDRGCYVLICNNDTSFVRKCFNNAYYTINEVLTKRFIGNSEKRPIANEVIIFGHK